MEGDIKIGPAGFVTYKRMIEEFGGEIYPYKLNEDERVEFIQRLSSIENGALMVGTSIHARERWYLRDDAEYVRYEVTLLGDEHAGMSPCQLLSVWNSDKSLRAYTFLHDTGLMKNFVITMYSASNQRCEHSFDFEQALAFSKDMKQDDWVKITNSDYRYEYVQINKVDHFPCVTWQVFRAPYRFNGMLTENIFCLGNTSYPLNILKQDGICGLQKHCEWVATKAD